MVGCDCLADFRSPSSLIFRTLHRRISRACQARPSPSMANSFDQKKGGDDVPDACGEFAVAPERRAIAKTIRALRRRRGSAATHSGDRTGSGPLYQQLAPARLHSPHVSRPTTAFGGHPDNVLARVLDVAGFAMHAILRIDLQARAFRGCID